MKRLSTFVKTSLLFTGITLLVNYFDFDQMAKDGRKNRRKFRRFL